MLNLFHHHKEKTPEQKQAEKLDKMELAQRQRLDFADPAQSIGPGVQHTRKKSFWGRIRSLFRINRKVRDNGKADIQRSAHKMDLLNNVHADQAQTGLNDNIKGVLKQLETYSRCDVNALSKAKYRTLERDSLVKARTMIEETLQNTDLLSEKEKKLLHYYQDRISIMTSGYLQVPRLADEEQENMKDMPDGSREVVLRDQDGNKTAIFRDCTKTVFKEEVEEEVKKINDKKKDGERKQVLIKTRDASQDPLFPHEPSINDVRQGCLGDCYMLAGLSSLVETQPQRIKDCMKDNGDSVTVRFFTHSNKEGAPPVPIYVTVSKQVPDNDYYARGSLWVQLIERAYSASRLHLSRTDSRDGYAAYEEIAGGSSSDFLFDLLGQSCTASTHITDSSQKYNAGIGNVIAGEASKDAIFKAIDPELSKKRQETYDLFISLSKTASAYENQKTTLYSNIMKKKKDLLGKDEAQGLSEAEQQAYLEKNTDYAALKKEYDDCARQAKSLSTQVADLSADFFNMGTKLAATTYQKTLGLKPAANTTDYTQFNAQGEKAFKTVFSLVSQYTQKFADDVEIKDGNVTKQDKLYRRAFTIEELKKYLTSSKTRRQLKKLPALKNDAALNAGIQNFLKNPDLVEKYLESIQFVASMQHEAFSGVYTESAKQLFDDIQKQTGKKIINASTYTYVKENMKLTHKGLNNEYTKTGLVEKHAYSVLGVEEIERDGRNLRFVKMRNPWAQTGREYDLDEKSSKRTDLSAEDTGGIFYAELNDYMQNFRETTFTNLS